MFLLNCKCIIFWFRQLGIFLQLLDVVIKRRLCSLITVRNLQDWYTRWICWSQGTTLIGFYLHSILKDTEEIIKTLCWLPNWQTGLLWHCCVVNCAVKQCTLFLYLICFPFQSFYPYKQPAGYLKSSKMNYRLRKLKCLWGFKRMSTHQRQS